MTVETARHDWEPSNYSHAMHTDPVCNVCGEPRKARMHR